MAVDMFIKIKGVDGESKDQKHGKEIDVLSWSWGMSNSGSAHVGGVPAFRYNPADVRHPALLDMLDEPVRRLANDLGIEFAGRSITVRALYSEHNVGRPYVPANYRAALRILEDSGRARMNPPAESRRRVKGEVTLPDEVVVTFPALLP